MMSYLRSTSTVAVSSILVACAMFMFTGSAQAQSLARFDFNGQAGQGENGGPTQTGWSGFDASSLGNWHAWGPPGTIEINVGTDLGVSLRDRLPEFAGVSNLESSPVVDVTRDMLIAGNIGQTLQVRVRNLEPNTEYDLRWHHYEPAFDDPANVLAIYTETPMNLIVETDEYGQSSSNFWTDFSATADGTGRIDLTTGPHSQWDPANEYFSGFEVLSVVPEPSSLALLGAAVVGLLGFVRRKSR